MASSEYDLDDSEAEAAMPPADLLQRAREILAYPVSLQQVARAWDRSSHLPSEEQRVAACLDNLLNEQEQQDLLRVNAPAQPVVPPAPARASPIRNQPIPQRQLMTPSPSKSKRKPPYEIIDLSEDSPAAAPHAGPSNSGRKRKWDEQDDDLLPMVKAPKFEDMPRRGTPKVEPASASKSEVGHGPSKSATASPKSVNTSQDTRNAALAEQQAVRLNQASHPDPILISPQRQLREDAANLPPEEEPSLVVQVLSVIPDVDAEHVQQLVEKYSSHNANCVEQVIDALLSDKSYPKAQPANGHKDKGKETGKSTGDDELRARFEAYLDFKKRCEDGLVLSFTYREAGLQYLSDEHPGVPVPFVRQTFYNNGLFWAPTHHELLRMSATPEQFYKPLKVPRRVKGKGAAIPEDADLLAERQCYFAKLARDKGEEDAKLAIEMAEMEEEAQGHTFECGCCCDDVVFSKMIQCPEAHLFCITCARKNAEHILGNRGCEVTCMDQSGCTEPFTDDECKKFLREPQLLLLEKIRSEKAVEAAGLDGLSCCPHCSYGCVIENPDEELFYCLNEECMHVTCRKCKKPDHLPKSCEEYAADAKTDKLHEVEEAMTEALLRRCPKCETPVLKEDGCNKMTCRKCNILFCYVCSKHIQGYNHFDQRMHYQALPPAAKSTLCPLWDDTATREYEQVEAARKAAIKRLQEERGDPDAQISEEELEKLGLKKPPPRAMPGLPAGMGVPYVPPPAPPGRPAGLVQGVQGFVVPPAHDHLGVARANIHNALLNAVNNDWNRYIAEINRIREGVARGEQFQGPGAVQAAARMYAAHIQGQHGIVPAAVPNQAGAHAAAQAAAQAAQVAHAARDAEFAQALWDGAAAYRGQAAAQAVPRPPARKRGRKAKA